MTSNKKNAMSALLAIAFIQLSTSAVTPALATMSAKFSNISQNSIALLTTLPSLMSIPSTLIASSFVGKQLKYKSLVIFGFLCLLLGGIGPCLTENFYIILVWRAIFGIGIGCVIPLVMPLTMLFFNKEEVQGVMGANSISTNVGAILFQLLGGLLCSRFGWHATFFIYFLLIPCAIVAFLMPEPEKQEQSLSESTEVVHNNSLRGIMKWLVIDFFYMVFCFTLITQTSSAIAENGFGSSTVSGIALSLFTAGGVLGGIIFRKSKKITGNVFIIIFANMFAGFVLMTIANNVIVFLLGEVFVGLGFGMFNPACNISVGLIVGADARARAASLLSAIGNLGGFLSVFLLSRIITALHLSGSSYMFLLSAIFFMLMLVITPLTHVRGIPQISQTKKN